MQKSFCVSPPPAQKLRSSSVQRAVGNALSGGEDRDTGRAGVNVKVIVRCRPLSDFERKDPSQYQVVSTKPDAKEVFVSQTIPGRKVESYSKTFTFDGVGNQFTTQQDLFNTYIVSIVDEVLQGFNCTIFAYGQTGTGKTYTMEGDIYARMAAAAQQQQRGLLLQSATASGGGGGVSTTAGLLVGSSSCSTLLPSSSLSPSVEQNPVLSMPQRLQFASPTGSVLSMGSSASVQSVSFSCSHLTEQAGIIPRAVQHIFERLEAQDTEYSVRVSYLEIYNEELNDLLNDGERQHLRIFEDSTGKKGLSVDRLEEIPVNNPQDIFNVLSIAVKKRRTAETLLNRQSSRSHCIFSVMIHMKETNIDGEDVIKIGKLNLVDLAGSENIQRSGANTIKDRAKEAGMINQSLLTLGRVINALVEHSSYVPYRDSKLTRLLQESLGGRTKTCIVATISASSLCLEETLSTLDYAFRAKNIRNRPEVNQKTTKRVMIREMNHEIERLKIELQANRDKNGVYLPVERFSEMEMKICSQFTELTEATNEIAKVKSDLLEANQELVKVKGTLEVESSAHAIARNHLETMTQELSTMRQLLQTTEMELAKETFVSQHLRNAEQSLQSLCQQLSSEGKDMAHDLGVLQAKFVGCRSLGKEQVLLFEGLSKRGLLVRQSILGELDDWYRQWSKSLEGIKNHVVNDGRVFEAASKTELADRINLLQQVGAQQVEKISGFWNALDVWMNEFHTTIERCISDQVKSTDEEALELLRSTGEAADNICKQLQSASDLVYSLPNHLSAMTTANKEVVGQLVSGIQSTLSKTRSAMDLGFTEQSASVAGLIQRLFKFKQERSEGLRSSLDTIRQQLSQLADAQDAEFNTEFAELSESCQQLQHAQSVLQSTSGETLSVSLPELLSRFHTDLLPTLDRYDELSSSTAKQHGASTKQTMLKVQENQDLLLLQWHAKQQKKHHSFIKESLPSLLHTGHDTMIALQSTFNESCSGFSEAIRSQSNHCNNYLNTTFTELSTRMDLLESQLSEVRTVMDVHRSKLHNSIQDFESTSLTDQQSSESLSTGFKSSGNTPQPRKSEKYAPVIPRPVPPREELIALYRGTNQEQDIAIDTTDVLLVEASTAPSNKRAPVSIRSPEPERGVPLIQQTASDSSHTDPPQPQQLLIASLPFDTTKSVVSVSSISYRTRVARTAGGSRMRASSLTRKPREGNEGALNGKYTEGKRASAAPQIRVGHQCRGAVDTGDTTSFLTKTTHGFKSPSGNNAVSSFECLTTQSHDGKDVRNEEAPSSLLGSPDRTLRSASRLPMPDDAFGAQAVPSPTDSQSERREDDVLPQSSFSTSSRMETALTDERRSDSHPNKENFSIALSHGSSENPRSMQEQKKQRQQRSVSTLGDEVALSSDDNEEPPREARFTRPTNRFSQTLRRKHQAGHQPEEEPEGKRRRGLSRDSRR